MLFLLIIYLSLSMQNGLEGSSRTVSIFTVNVAEEPDHARREFQAVNDRPIIGTQYTVLN